MSSHKARHNKSNDTDSPHKKREKPRTFQPVNVYGTTLTQVKAKGWIHSIITSMKEWNVPHQSHYYVTMKHCKSVETLEYLMTPMFQTTPSYLYCTYTTSGNPISLLLVATPERRTNMYICPFRFSETLYDNNTVIACDVVERNDGQFALFAFDIWHHGSSLSIEKCSQIERVQYLQTLLETQYIPDSGYEKIPLFIKHMYTLHELHEMTTKCDGYLKTKMIGISLMSEAPKSKQKKPFMVKLAQYAGPSTSNHDRSHAPPPSQHRTKIMVSPPVQVSSSHEPMTLYIQKEDELECYTLWTESVDGSSVGQACMRQMDVSMKLREMFSASSNRVKCHCTWNKFFQKYEPKKIEE